MIDSSYNNITLCDDILNLIISQSNNYYCTIVCKDWYNAVLQNSIVCKDCNKIVKMYGTDLWFTDEDDSLCHGYYDNLTKYKKIKEMINFNTKIVYKIDRFSIGLIFYITKNYKNGNIIDALKQKNMLDFWINNSENTSLMFVRYCGLALEYITDQTEEICIEAVKNNPEALKYVNFQTEKICLEAVKKNGSILKYVNIQTDKICLEAMKYCISSYDNPLKYVENQTEEICLEAIKNSPSYNCPLEHVKNQTDKICLEAVKKNGKTLKYVKNQTEEICMEAINEYSNSFCYVTNQTEKICLFAVRKNGNLLEYVKNQTEDICMEAIKKGVDNFKYILNPTISMYIYVYENDKGYYRKIMDKI